MPGGDVEKPVKQAPDYLVPPIIAKALIKIQKELQPLVKSAQNDAYESTYVPLDVVTEKAHKLLSDHKIAVMQPMVTDDQGHAALETILIYEDGRSFSRTTKLAMNKVDPQAHGSAVTYTRRYALMAMIGLTAKDEDDDGNKATGVYAPVTEAQIDEIKMLLSLIPWPKEQIAKATFALKTRDAADLAIEKYRKIVSEKKRDEESKANATKIEISEDDTIMDSDPLSHEALQKRITALGLNGKGAENKFVYRIVGKPFLSRVTKQEDLEELSKTIELLETGKHSLPAEFYPPLKEPRTVEEDVA